MTNRSGVTAILLAGGRSTRFGGPKLAAELAGEPLLLFALRAMGTVADEIIVVGAPSQLPTADSLQVRSIRTIPDDEPFAGPLAALAGALRATTTQLALVAGGDMPGLAPAVLEAMLERLAANENLDAVILASPAADQAPRQVLPLALRVSSATENARQAIEAGDRSLVRLLDRLRFVDIPAIEWLALDPTGSTLLDVDRPEDLERIQQNFR